MSGAHCINYERKKSGAHVFLEERVMSAKFSNERVMSAKFSNERVMSAKLSKERKKRQKRNLHFGKFEKTLLFPLSKKSFL